MCVRVQLLKHAVYHIFGFSSSVIEDEAGVSKGYGFVRFYDEAEQNRAFEELDNSTGLGSKPIRVKPANNNPRQKLVPLSCEFVLLIARSDHRQSQLFYPVLQQLPQPRPLPLPPPPPLSHLLQW